MKRLSLFIQSVIMLNERAVLSTQYLIMLMLCCYVKKLGYLVYETCELVCTDCIFFFFFFFFCLTLVMFCPLSVLVR